MKIVLDTNCLLQIIFPQSYHKEVWDAFFAGQYTLCFSNEILLEYREIIARRTGDAIFAENVVEAILSAPNIERVTPYYHFNMIIADPDDNKFVDCAITAGATFIVSNDKHFDELANYDYPKVDVRNLTEFMQLLRNSN